MVQHSAIELYYAFGKNWWTWNNEQAAMAHSQNGREDLLYIHLSKRKELWLDFMADTGDGGNSTYSIARLLAQPSLCVMDEHCRTYHELPRSNLLLVGGDLALVSHPNPFIICHHLLTWYVSQMHQCKQLLLNHGHLFARHKSMELFRTITRRKAFHSNHQLQLMTTSCINK